MSATLTYHEADILERAIESAGGQWAPEVAKAVMSIKLSPADVARMSELAAKAERGALGADEEIEIESYRSASRVLEILKLHARVALKRHESPKAASA